MKNINITPFTQHLLTNKISEQEESKNEQQNQNQHQIDVIEVDKIKKAAQSHDYQQKLQLPQNQQCDQDIGLQQNQQKSKSLNNQDYNVSSPKQINFSSIYNNDQYQNSSSHNGSRSNNYNDIGFRQQMQNHLDQFFYKVGNADWYQKQAFGHFSLQALCVSCYLTSVKFYFQEPQFDCPANFQNQNPLFQDFSCEQWVCYQVDQDSSKHYSDYLSINQFQSATIDFDLVCQYSYARFLLVGISFLFTIFGLILFGYYGDNNGRKQTLQTCWKIFTIGFLIFPFMQVFPLFLIGYFLCSFSCYPAIVLQITLLNEQSAGKTRQRFGAGIWFVISFGQFLFTLLVPLINNWRYLSVITGSLPVLILNWIIKNYFESARFYYPTNKLKSLQILNKIAIVNKRPMLYVNLENSTWIEDWQIHTKKFLDLFKYKSLKTITIPGYIMMSGLYFLYYGSEQEIYSVQGMNYDLKIICMYVVKFCAFALVTTYIHKIERLKYIKFTTIITTTLFLIYYLIIFLETDNAKNYNEFINDWDFLKVLSLIFAISSRFFCSVNNIISFVYFAEMYPTSIRCIGLGTILTTQQIAYFSIYMIYSQFTFSEEYDFGRTINRVILGTFIMIVSALAGLLPSFKLYETKNKQLEDEIKEIAISEYDDFIILEDEKKTE